jgi:hypothetical protein
MSTVSESANDPQRYVRAPTLTVDSLTTAYSVLKLTPQESEAIKDKGRWLRRVVNPFTDFYMIVAIGAAGSPTTTEAAGRRREERQARDHAKDLYVQIGESDHHK